LFVSLISIALLCSWPAVLELLRLSYAHEQYSHIFLVLPVSLSLLFLERRAKPIKIAWCPVPGIIIVLSSFIVAPIAQWWPVLFGNDAGLSMKILALVLCWLGLVLLFYGIQFFKSLLFPLLFVLTIVPLPQSALDTFNAGLQRASVEATCALFRLVNVPVLKNGFVLSLPGLDIEVAKECSGIRSTIVLLVTSLVLAHLCLRSNWTKVLLALAVFPLAVAKNAVRIFTLSILAIYVDPGFLQGPLHRRGGILFFVLALAGILVMLWVMRLAESCARKSTSAACPSPNILFLGKA
jgi:exosortase